MKWIIAIMLSMRIAVRTAGRIDRRKVRVMRVLVADFSVFIGS